MAFICIAKQKQVSNWFEKHFKLHFRAGKQSATLCAVENGCLSTGTELTFYVSSRFDWIQPAEQSHKYHLCLIGSEIIRGASKIAELVQRFDWQSGNINLSPPLVRSKPHANTLLITCYLLVKCATFGRLNKTISEPSDR